MSTIEQIVNKPIKEMTAIEYLIYEKYIQWNQNGRPKDPRNDKAGHDAIQAAAELAAMQARIEKVCKWGLLDDEEWETSCNETIYMEGLPDEDWKFCPFCGGKIKDNT